MPTIEGLEPGLQFAGTLVFVICVGAFAAWSLIFGKKPRATETREFSLAGQLADMGPVKELVEQTGLLVQQQVRTNMHLEKVADALKAAAEIYQEQMEAQATQEEVEERAQQLFERRLAEQRPARRRVRRKTPATPKGGPP